MLEHSADDAAVSDPGVAAVSPGVAAVSPARGRLTRILVADDHEIVRLGLRAILEATAGWKVVAEAADGKEAIAKALASKPDIVIMDYCMPIMNGVEATRQIHARLPNTEIMIFTVHDSDVLVGELLQAGARAYLLKSEAQATPRRRGGIPRQSQAVLHRPHLGTFARCLSKGVPGQRRRRRVLSARTDDRAAHSGRPQQQGERGDPQSERQDDRDPPRDGDAQTQPHLDRSDRPLCGPPPVGRTVESASPSGTRPAWKVAERAGTKSEMREAGHQKDHANDRQYGNHGADNH
jgi:DNA-binding NarL/FixJ family response regulator